MTHNNRASNFYPNLYNPADAAQFTSPDQRRFEHQRPGIHHGSGVKLSNVPFYLNGVGLAGRNGIPRGLVQNHYLTFAPRIGFAYDVYGNGKTILRGGFGIFYERNARQRRVQHGRQRAVQQQWHHHLPLPGYHHDLLDHRDERRTVTHHAARLHRHTGEVPAYHGVSVQLGNPATGAKQHGGHAWVMWATLLFTCRKQADINTVPANDPNRIHICGGNCGCHSAATMPTTIGLTWALAGVNIVDNEGNAHYDGLQATFRATAWKNVTFGAAYTWSHAWDVIDGQLFNNSR